MDRFVTSIKQEVPVKKECFGFLAIILAFVLFTQAVKWISSMPIRAERARIEAVLQTASQDTIDRYLRRWAFETASVEMDSSSLPFEQYIQRDGVFYIPPTLCCLRTDVNLPFVRTGIVLNEGDGKYLVIFFWGRHDLPQQQQAKNNDLRFTEGA